MDALEYYRASGVLIGFAAPADMSVAPCVSSVSCFVLVRRGLWQVGWEGRGEDIPSGGETYFEENEKEK